MLALNAAGMKPAETRRVHKAPVSCRLPEPGAETKFLLNSFFEFLSEALRNKVSGPWLTPWNFLC